MLYGVFACLASGKFKLDDLLEDWLPLEGT